MSATAVERAPARAPAPAPEAADSPPRAPARAPEGAPAVRLLEAAPAPPANVPPEVGGVVRSPGPGAPLPAAVGGAISAGLGVDVAPVRVHADAQSAGAAEAVSARAFTYGTHVYLGPGESPHDLPLVAHEVAHVVQQQGAPAVQLFGGGPDPGPLEHEAQRAAAAVAAGGQAAVLGRTTPAVQRQFGWARRAARAVGGAVRAVGGAVRSAASAVAEGAAGLLARAVNYVKERARSIPGYDLVAFALGRDPITQEAVPRNALNLIRAVVGLIPGGAALLQHLTQSGALQRAFGWATGELERLGLTWTNIRGAVSRFIDSLGASDLLNLGGVFQRARAMFGPLLSAAVRFAAAAGRKLLEFVFEAVMASAGGQRIVGIFRRIGETFNLIVSDPVRFVGNLVAAVRGAFRRFAANILGHLRTALFEWLLGALRGALTLPSRWDLAGIVSVVLQVLGLTYQALRTRLVRLIGERAVGYVETAFEFVRTIVTRGLAAAWDKIVEFATGLVDTVIEAIRNWVARSIVGAAVTRLVTMFNPVGALIQSIIAIYNTIMFFVERAQQIAALLESIVDSISSIARGNLGAAMGFVERTMARVLPVLISFLARLIGLGNISGTIREIIGRIRGVVDRAIDRIVDWVVARVRPLLARLTGTAAPAAGGPDARTNEQKERDLRLAVGAATAIVRDDRVTERQRRERLTTIRTQYRLNALDLVTVRETRSNKTVRVRGAVNPTFDSDGYVIDNWPEDEVIVRVRLGKPHRRRGYEDVLERATEVGLGPMQRLHASGAGFGAESTHGIYYGVAEVNQELQNRGIERFLRDTYRQRHPQTTFTLDIVVRPQPGTNILGHVTYRLFGQKPGEPRRTQILEVWIEVLGTTLTPEITFGASGGDAAGTLSTLERYLR